MANSTKGVGENKESTPKVSKITLVQNKALQPREFKIGGKWYRWNALGTKGDTLDMTGINLGEYTKYFSVREVEKCED